MKTTITPRGFALVEHETYIVYGGKATRLVQESSAVGDYDDAFKCSGSSFLWIGPDHHLNREEVSELITMMMAWLADKKLPV